MSDLAGKARALLSLLKHSRRTVALTGAGISTEAGIPDFRSPGGLWDQFDPYESFSAWGFRRDPSELYRVGETLQQALLTAQPTFAHLLLARLERLGMLRAIITQNIDGLHQRAGSRKVLEIHGTLQSYTSLSTGRKFSLREIRTLIEEHGIPPRCPVDGGLIKPDIVLFGEELPAEAFGQARTEAHEADLMLCIGTSMVVAPASDLPELTLANGGKLAILNLTPTPYDARAAVTLPFRLGEISKWLLEHLPE